MHFSALINFNWIYLVYINFFCKKKKKKIVENVVIFGRWSFLMRIDSQYHISC